MRTSDFKAKIPSILALLIVWCSSVALYAVDGLQTEPSKVTGAEPFRVYLMPDSVDLAISGLPAGVTYAWEIEVLDSEGMATTAEDSNVEKKDNVPALIVKSRKSNFTYKFKLNRKLGADTKPFELVVDPDPNLAQATTVTLALASKDNREDFDVAEAGEAFDVFVKEDVMTDVVPDGVKYDWSVLVSDLTTKKQVTEDNGVPTTFANKSFISFSKSRPNSKYEIKLTKSIDDKKTSAEFTWYFGEAGTNVSPTLIPGQAPMEEPKPAVAEPKPKPLPATEKRAFSEKLKAARLWADEAAKIEFASLVIPVSFFEEKLTTAKDGKKGIKTNAIVPLLDVIELHRAMQATAAAFPSETNEQRFVAEWFVEREKFLVVLAEEVGEVDLAIKQWEEFTDEWEKEVAKVAPGRFREALLQASLIATAVLLGHEKAHIEAALKGSGGAASAGGSTSSYGTSRSSGGSSHAVLHHDRAMSRIRFRHERWMQRIGN